MQLADGLIKYQSDPTYGTLTLPLESYAQRVLVTLRKYGDQPTPHALSEAKRFLIEVEKWKAGCLQQRMGRAVQNSEWSIWGAFQGAVRATSDVEAILSIMRLRGFGAAIDDESGQRRAKVATSVLRFLWPHVWGVVDWRVAVILGLLNKHSWDVDKALAEAKKQKAEELRNLYDIINEQAACEINQQYRQISKRHPGLLPRAADVDMALFGLSLFVWEMP
jgi:hypothetical protein